MIESSKLNIVAGGLILLIGLGCVENLQAQDNTNPWGESVSSDSFGEAEEQALDEALNRLFNEMFSEPIYAVTDGPDWCTFGPAIPQQLVNPASPQLPQTPIRNWPDFSNPTNGGIPGVPENLLSGPIFGTGLTDSDGVELGPGSSSAGSGDAGYVPPGPDDPETTVPIGIESGVSVGASDGSGDDEPQTADDDYVPPTADDPESTAPIGMDNPVVIDGGGDSPDTGTNNNYGIFIKAKTSVLQPDGSTAETPAAGQPIKIIFPPGALPGTTETPDQEGHDAVPLQGVTDSDGLFAWLPSAAGQGADTQGIGFEFDVQRIRSYILEGSTTDSIGDLVDQVPDDLRDGLHQGQIINGTPFITLTFPTTEEDLYQDWLDTLNSSPAQPIVLEENFCRTKQTPSDPSFVRTASAGQSGSWGQPYDDQWAIKRVGLTADGDSAWNQVGKDAADVVVAIIDTGLDWNHLDISWDSIWRNESEIPDNKVDDDKNGYVDDIIGWDFQGYNNLPWDYDGHGTVVAGIIAATQDNDIGIAGINPNAKLMVLKALNAYGNSRASYIAESIVYAADNGARIINISVGGENLSRIESAAVEHARKKGALIIAAAGNEGQSLENYGPGGTPGVVTVAATDLEDARTIFSNWGPQVDIAAPGIDVLSLRARRTDTMLDIPDVDYVAAANYVGDDNRYYRASGTSFAAPIVTGIGSLVLSQRPELTADELQRILTQSADDTDAPGKDQFTGYGIINASAALSLDKEYYVESLISGAAVVQEGNAVSLAVSGTADANDFKRAWIEIGAGEQPATWKRVGEAIKKSVTQGVLTTIPAAEFAGSTEWVIRLTTEHDDGSTREAWFLLTLG